MEYNNNGPNGHLFYVGGDLMMRRGMLPIIMLPDGDLRKYKRNSTNVNTLYISL